MSPAIIIPMMTPIMKVIMRRMVVRNFCFTFKEIINIEVMLVFNYLSRSALMNPSY